MRFLLLILVGVALMSNFSVADQSKEIRTYFSVSEPIDPARVLTMEDTEMSYALATTLVDWDDSKQIISRLAARWTVSEKTLEFRLSDKALWSDGQPITSEQVKQSLERARRKYGTDLKSFFDSVTAIKTPDAKTLVLELSVANSAPAVLKKLTEPMYGIVRVVNHEQADLTTTSGPYYLSTHTAQETVLKRNSHWVHFDSGMAERIILRKSATGVNAQSLLISDSWPNLVATHSLMGESLLASLKQRGLIFWERNLDRTFLLTSMNGRLKEEELFQLFRFLQKNIDRSEISRGLTGHTPADQLFPRGSSMYVENLKCTDFSSEIPSSLRGKKLNVLISPERVAPEIRDNFARAVKKATGIEPEFTEVPLNQLSSAVKARHHDFYLGSVGVADPNYEGALSFFFETTPPIIASGTGEQNLAQRTIQVRKEKDEFKRIASARSMLQDAVCYGHFVPLFQYSTTVIARPELDLSKIPSTDESVSFSKVRFR
jgi:MarR-like DNA-binding transcriptional regulator SgrR of sgrS sRNA